MKKVVRDFDTTILLENEEPKTICRLGQGEKCCAYLVLGADGFECAKQQPSLGIQIKYRLSQGLIVAKGEGSWEGCPWKKASIG